MTKRLEYLSREDVEALKDTAEELGHGVVLKLIKSTTGYEIPGTGRFTLKDTARYLEVKEPSLRTTLSSIKDELEEFDYYKAPSDELIYVASHNGVDVSYNDMYTQIHFGEGVERITTPKHGVITVNEKVMVQLIFLLRGKTPLSTLLVSALGGKETNKPKAKRFSQRLVSGEVEPKTNSAEEPDENVYAMLVKMSTLMQEHRDEVVAKEKEIAELKEELGKDKEPTSERLDMLETNSTLQLIVAFLLNPKYKDSQHKLLAEALKICEECGVEV